MNNIEEIKTSFDEPLASILLGNYLKTFFRKNTLYHNAIIVCIGTDKCIGDCLGPLVGTLLQKRKFPLSVYGTLSDPIHALNIKKKLHNIREKHPSAITIAVDACLGDDDSIGNIQIRSGSIYPGKGVGKKLPSVGNISIIGIVDSLKNDNNITLHNIRLSFVMEMAEVIVDSLIRGL